jgi:phosphatidylinositol glycan class O
MQPSTRLSLSVLSFIALVHLSGLFLFSRGFLLTRLALPDIASCSSPDSADPCTLSPTHDRAIILIIDALRFDFLSPSPPIPPSAYHHGVLTLPAELTREQPTHSVLFDAYADPPTTTLQRIKALVTGSLPTFVDMSANFGAASIQEDSLIHQLRLANKTVSAPWSTPTYT